MKRAKTRSTTEKLNEFLVVKSIIIALKELHLSPFPMILYKYQETAS